LVAKEKTMRNIVIKAIQVGFDVTASHQVVRAIGLTTNAGAISLIPVGEDQVRISTFDKDQFERWCAKLTEANCPFTTAVPVGF
jgi:hypothetical protein